MRILITITASMSLFLGACSLHPNTSSVLTKVDVPSPAELDLNDLSGSHYRISDYRGKVVIVHFWSSWCVVCKAQIQPLKQLQSQIGKDNLIVLTVGIDDSSERLQEVAKREQNPFPVLVDSAGTVKKYFDISTVPVGLVFDTNGNIARIPDPDSGEMVTRLEGPKWWYKDSMVAAIRNLLVKPSTK